MHCYTDDLIDSVHLFLGRQYPSVVTNLSGNHFHFHFLFLFLATKISIWHVCECRHLCCALCVCVCVCYGFPFILYVFHFILPPYCCVSCQLPRFLLPPPCSPCSFGPSLPLFHLVFFFLYSDPSCRSSAAFFFGSCIFEIPLKALLLFTSFCCCSCYCCCSCCALDSRGTNNSDD